MRNSKNSWNKLQKKTENMNLFLNPLHSRYESQLSFVVWNWLIPDFPVIPWMGYLIYIYPNNTSIFAGFYQ